MDTVKLSSKGQVVIPKAIREGMHFPPGTEFVVSVSATGLTLPPKSLFPSSTPEQVRGCLAGGGRALPDEAEIKARIRARLRAQDEDSKDDTP